jgi:hypothetical protein
MTTFSDIETKHKEDTTMKRRELLYALAAGFFLSASGCVVAERGGRGRRETYYYYPDYEVYFYPHVGRYYWRERDEWRHGDRPPPRFVLRDRERVRIDMDHEPHTDHDRIKKSHPPGRYDRDDRKDERKDDRK